MAVGHPRLVTVSIVTYNSAEDLPVCLESVSNQSYPNLELILVDNASTDGTASVIEKWPGEIAQVHLLDGNRGYCGGHNLSFERSNGDYVLVLNPDVRLERDFLACAVAAIESDERIGSVSGKLLRPNPDKGVRPDLLDSAGIYMTPNQRHLDRGSREEDRGQYERPQFVFGASGAAALYRKAMLEDLRVGGQILDEDFFSYREDADLAWRAQILGWRARYEPTAVARHERRVVPENRSDLSSMINMHSVKNRFLLRIKNQTFDQALKFLFPALIRDLQVLVYVCLFERSSLPGLSFVIRNIGRTWSKRKEIMSRRKATLRYLSNWFQRAPVAFDCDREPIVRTP